jgi:protein TonB
VAEKLLIHKQEIQWHNQPMEARVMGTVVVDIEISAQGNVASAQIISGPRMLRQPVLDAVRKYKYKPYLLNGKPVEVETTVSVACQNF